MSSTVYHNAKNNISKWLIAVVLLSGLFAFSGLPLSNSINSPQQQTGISVGKSSRPINHIAFNGAIKRANVKPTISPFIVSPFINLISFDNIQIKVCLKSCGTNLHGPNKGFFYRVKTTTSTSERPDISLT